MPDWTRPMQQTFEYYEVDPTTWTERRQIRNVESSSVNRELSSDTLGKASIVTRDDIGECYVRIYLVTIQDGVQEKTPLGTFLVQTPSISIDSTSRKCTLDCYTPLIELKEKRPQLGYTIFKGASITDMAYTLVSENVRCPVVKMDLEDKLTDDFVANTSDTWLSFCSDLLYGAKLYYGLDELGRVIFEPRQDVASLQPVWSFDDGNSSILYPDATVKRDLFGVPNQVTVIYSSSTDHFEATVTNDDPNSATSVQSRGRIVPYVETSPKFTGIPTQAYVEQYAKDLLTVKSSLEYTVTYSHGYCPVRPGDCVRLTYRKAGLDGIKARVTAQQIENKAGCKVTETATYTVKYWG